MYLSQQNKKKGKETGGKKEGETASWIQWEFRRGGSSKGIGEGDESFYYLRQEGRKKANPKRGGGEIILAVYGSGGGEAFGFRGKA